MTDALRDLLTRKADDADPMPPDPTVWARARRTKRRGELLSATAVGAAVFALVATVGVVAQPDPSRLDPNPAEQERPGIPSLVRGVIGDGGLELESDLSVGVASVAIANPTGAFVVTAEDGEYHRLDLPGFDASIYDDHEVRRTGMVGLQLSPDGSRLAYGWHGPLPEQTGQQHGFVRSGLRILDLRAGRVENVPEDRRPPGEFAYAIRNQDFPWGRVPYGMRWSADGRYLAYDLVWAAAPIKGQVVEHWGDGLEEAYSHSNWASGASVYDTANGRRFDVRETRFGDSDLWLSAFWREGWPQAVGDDGTIATVDVNNALALAPLGGRISTSRALPGGPSNDDYTVGLFDGRSAAILETRTPSSHLLAVDLRTGAHEQLKLPLSPVQVDLLDWIGPDHVLAQVRQGDEVNLIVFDLSDADVESNLVAPFDDEGMRNTFSFATDFATMKNPTHDFEESTDGGAGSSDAGAPLPGADDAEPAPDRTWLLAGLAGGLAAAALVVLFLRRRIRTV